nr:TlpA disulfide reductase family protein [Candidatus Krumholzibacteria bacterium]
MLRHLTLFLVALALAAGCAGTSPSPTPEETTLTAVGQLAPDFTVETLDGGTFTLGEQRGQVVLVNWFATWCPPCQEEMPHLQSEVWEVFRDQGLVLVSVAREETAEVVRPFIQKYAVTWPFLLDPDRSAYARYAEAFIPRNHVIDREGRIIFQSSGFEREDFEEMIGVIRAALSPQEGAPRMEERQEGQTE